MGCVSSKKSVAGSPVVDYSAAQTLTNDNATLNCVIPLNNPCGAIETDGKEEKEKQEDHHHDKGSRLLRKSKKGISHKKTTTFGIKLGLSHRHVDAEQIAAGWPAWLTAAAPEAVHGLVPLRAEAFEKLDKVGQGTYSSVFRAREVATGKTVALKKVRFDNFQPESIRFMAREIMILRRLDHPNIVKLEGVITSRLSSSIYLVFEYMEHDFAGLLTGGIKFTEPQIKCYMKQLLHAVEHCHLRGIMHRDIKTSNILLNNQGTLKLADFGLANFLSTRSKQKLTSRVVTLWYRPPELLMGSTNYNLSVDLWSVGCVFAELIIGKPILKGRTEVEQLHKIFRLCGSPPEDYWAKAKLPHGDMFKPQNNYEGCLRERCKEFPTSAVNLIEIFLSIDPSTRGTASSALMSEYFFTTPYACDPSELPIYPPKKELDAKYWDDARRKKARARLRESAAPKRPRRVRQSLQEPISDNKLATKEDDVHVSNRNAANNAPLFKGRGTSARGDSLNRSTDMVSVTSARLVASQGDPIFIGPAPVSASSGFAWATRRKDDAKSILSSRSQISAMDSSSLGFVDKTFGDLIKEGNQIRTDPKKNKLCENSSVPMSLQPKHCRSTISFDASDMFDSQGYELAVSDKEDQPSHRKNPMKGDVKFSGPLLTESRRVDEILQRNENNILQANRRSRFYRER